MRPSQSRSSHSQTASIPDSVVPQRTAVSSIRSFTCRNSDSFAAARSDDVDIEVTLPNRRGGSGIASGWWGEPPEGSVEKTHHDASRHTSESPRQPSPLAAGLARSPGGDPPAADRGAAERVRDAAAVDVGAGGKRRAPWEAVGPGRADGDHGGRDRPRRG